MDKEVFMKRDYLKKVKNSQQLLKRANGKGGGREEKNRERM